MQMMNKKGAFYDEAPLELIIGIVVAGLAIGFIVLLFKFFSPGFGMGDEIAESYFERLEEVIALADEEKEAGFFILDNGDSDLDTSGRVPPAS